MVDIQGGIESKNELAAQVNLGQNHMSKALYDTKLTCL